METRWQIVQRVNAGVEACTLARQNRATARLNGSRRGPSGLDRHVSALSETLRAELAPQGIRVVEIMPGPVDSDMLRHSQETMVAPAGEPYRAVADHMNASKSMVASMIQPAGDAARLIVDAILDDDGPMRYGCDPMSTGMIDAWRRASDEEMMRGMLEQLVPEGAVRPR